MQNVASLNGLRSVARLSAINQHFSYSYSQAFLEGGNREEAHQWIVQFAIIGIHWSARAMVAIIFVISGCVLSNRPLNQYTAIQIKPSAP
jgi:peptidoglycan/LPS O-acetylase OafA/YrhL